MFLLCILERQIINVLVIHKNELVKRENESKKNVKENQFFLEIDVENTLKCHAAIK